MPEGEEAADKRKGLLAIGGNGVKSIKLFENCESEML